MNLEKTFVNDNNSQKKRNEKKNKTKGITNRFVLLLLKNLFIIIFTIIISGSFTRICHDHFFFREQFISFFVLFFRRMWEDSLLTHTHTKILSLSRNDLEQDLDFFIQLLSTVRFIFSSSLYRGHE